jgi:hypothetical protein
MLSLLAYLIFEGEGLLYLALLILAIILIIYFAKRA